jgi:hypothetical protein
MRAVGMRSIVGSWSLSDETERSSSKKPGHRTLSWLSAMPLFVAALAAENRFPGAPEGGDQALFDQDVTARRRFFHCHRPASAPTAIKPRTIELGSGTAEKAPTSPDV